MKEPIKILHIVGIMNRGGIETFLMNVLRRVDHHQYRFYFLITREEEGDYDNEIKSLGGKLIHVKHISKIGYFRYRKEIMDRIREHDFDVVHCHMNALSGFYLPIAKACHIPIRIAHCHSTKNSLQDNGLLKMVIKNYLRISIRKSATHFLACGIKAGKWLFGEEIAKKKLILIWNGINAKAFSYDEEKNLSIRDALQLNTSDFIVGHVGRMNYPKNQVFIIDIFNELLKKMPHSKLVIVGEGPLREEIEARIIKYSLEKQVYLLGLRNDVSKLMSMFDVLLMPSHYEGFPVTALEAQAASLPCVLSSNISDEVAIVDGLVEFVSLKAPLEEWVQALMDAFSLRRKDIDGASDLIQKGYDISSVTHKLLGIYRGEE